VYLLLKNITVMFVHICHNVCLKNGNITFWCLVGEEYLIIVKAILRISKLHYNTLLFIASCIPFMSLFMKDYVVIPNDPLLDGQIELIVETKTF